MTNIPATAPALPPGRRETFVGGAFSESTRVALHEIDAATHWAVWSERCGGYTISVWIELARWTPSAGWRTWTEGDGLQRYDCPMEFLDLASHCNDRAWRDAVLRLHKQEAAR